MGDHSIDVSGNSVSEPSKPCIFKVPNILRRNRPESFTPNSFSIGPLHYKKKYLKQRNKAEKIKQHYLDKLLTRKPTPQTTREDFKRSILEVEEKARKCYDVPFDCISKEEFVDMLVLDGCFIIEFLRNNNTIDEYDDPVFSVSWVVQVLYHDLILLENQIPWFVLVRLFDMTTSSAISYSTMLLTKLALNFFAKIYSANLLPKIEVSHKSNHILDLLRNSLVSSSGTKQESTGDSQLIPTATSLKESGIKFARGRSSNLLDIRFSFRNGVLEIPSLLIQEVTCEAFQNLISYEQCYPSCGANITSYVMLLSNLINTRKDIKLLCKEGIFDNRFNLNDTLEFFNYIFTDSYVKEFHYFHICEKMNEYMNRWWPRTRVAYARMFRDPIGSLSLFAAAIALILTLLQTLFTILQYIDSR